MKKIFTLCLLAFLGVSNLNAQTWSAVGPALDQKLNTNEKVFSTCTDAAGNVYAAGAFSNGNGQSYVAKWNGTNWTELGGYSSIMNSLPNISAYRIQSICIDASGNLYAAGMLFGYPPSTSVEKYYVLKWNGTVWSILGGMSSQFINNTIKSICTDAAGNVYAAGAFTNGATNTTGNEFVAKWNGTDWSELGGLNGLAANNEISTVHSDALGNIYAAGEFTNASGNKYVAKYNGSNWSEMGGLNGLSANNSIYSICSDSLGNIYTAGNFTDSLGAMTVAKWNGTIWTKTVISSGTIYCLYKDAFGNIYAGGQMSDSLGKPCIRKWDGNAWNQLIATNTFGGSYYVYTISGDLSGNLFVSGHFTINGDSKGMYVSKFNGSSWSELGGSQGQIFLWTQFGAPEVIKSICTDAMGNLYAAGNFDDGNFNFGAKKYVAKWNGTAWSALGGLNASFANGTIYSICTDASGNVYAAGNFSNGGGPDFGKKYVAKWNGSSWSELGGLNGLAANGSIESICTDALGNVYAAGNFTNSSKKYYVAKWNGSSWSELAGLNAPFTVYPSANISSICTDPSGNVYATGRFTNASGKNYVAKWNGTAWSELGGLNALAANGIIYSICSDAFGNVYAGGDFSNGVNSNSGKKYVAKWNGTVWSELGGLNGLSVSLYIKTICTDASGFVYVAGRFTNSSQKSYVAKYIGSRWIEMPDPNDIVTSSRTGGANSICTDPSGNVYAAAYQIPLGGLFYVAKFTCNSYSTPNVTIATSTNNVCEGNSMSFTATSTDGGSSPVYNFMVNGISKQNGSSNTYTTTALKNNDVVTCVLYANNVCQSAETDTSNAITMNLTPKVTPTISIRTDTTNICSGAPITFKATATNGGPSPTYTFRTTGFIMQTGSVDTFKTSTIFSATPVFCIITANNVCQTTSTVTSNTINVQTTPTFTPLVSITASTNNVCSGTSITFTATPTNGGPGPLFDFKVNGTSVQNGSSTTFASTTFNNNDIVSCSITANNVCQVRAVSNSSNVTVKIKTPTSSNNPLSICSSQLPYSWNGLSFNAAGSQTKTGLVNSVGCDSSATLSLTIKTNYIVTANAGSNGSISSSGNTSVCQGSNKSYTITADSSYHISSVLVDGLSIGALSTYTFNNVIANHTIEVFFAANCVASTSNTTHAACVSYMWNGTTYTSSGDYTAHLTNSCGLDSAATLHLTIKQSSASSNNASVCSNQLPFTWNGLIFNTAGSQTAHLINSVGCDSAATLVLSVSISSASSVSIAASANNVCANTNVIFTATPVNGGTTPIYQWKLNGNNMGSNSNTYSSTTLANNDIVSCVLTSNSACATNTTANSNAVTMIINSLPTIGTSSGGFICSIGGKLTLYNTNTNNGGVWTSSNTNVATVTTASNGAGGLATGKSRGTAILTYTKTNSNGCSASAGTIVTVINPIITGATVVCKGNTAQLSVTETGGYWVSNNIKASVSSTGLVTGVNAGIASISYVVGSCTNINTYTPTIVALPVVPTISYAVGSINPQLGATPSSAYCNNRTFTLVGTPSGGVWSSTNPSVLTVNSFGVASTVSVGTGSLVYTITNASGCNNNRSIVGTVVGCAARGVNTVDGQQSPVNGFTMYPNPAKSIININVETLFGKGSIVVTDLYGKSVKTQNLSMGTNTVNITNLSKGFYLVSIITSDGKTTKKLVVE